MGWRISTSEALQDRVDRWFSPVLNQKGYLMRRPSSLFLSALVLAPFAAVAALNCGGDRGSGATSGTPDAGDAGGGGRDGSGSDGAGDGGSIINITTGNGGTGGSAGEA